MVKTQKRNVVTTNKSVRVEKMEKVARNVKRDPDFTMTTRIVNESVVLATVKNESTDDTKEQKKNTKKKTWNDMLHLSIKRFLTDDDPKLTPGAKRNRSKFPYSACAEIDPTGRAVCKQCGGIVPKGSLRLSFMMECHKGYRNPCTMHKECFFQHREISKLDNANEICILPGVTKSQEEWIMEHFAATRKKSDDDNNIVKTNA